jgi:uncharacterized protein (AIM24 family)
MTSPGHSNPSAVPMTHCPFCGAQIPSAALSCPGCGSPVGRSPKPTNSGWTELAPIKDMARLRVGSSTCQIEGIYVPVADFNLAAGDSVYFAHHVLLWRDPQVEVRRMSLAGAFTRMLSGLPVVMTEAHGPGHIAFSRDEAGEMIALPLHPGQSVDVAEHMMLAATSQILYSWLDTFVWYTTRNGNETETHYPIGRYIDRFTAHAQPGLLLLHASGNVFVRELAAGQVLLIKPTSLVYKDPTVSMALDVQYPTGFILGNHRLMWLQLRGPGRVAIQSAYEPVEDNGRNIVSQSTFPWSRQGAGRGQLASAAVPAMSTQSSAPTGPPATLDPRHALIAKMVAAAMVNGQVPPEAMNRIIAVAAQHNLVPYDVHLIVKHVHVHGW